MLLLLLLMALVALVSCDVVINEIMYHHPANEMFEFLELFNNDASAAVSLQGWRVRIGKKKNFKKKEKKKKK